MPDRLQRPEGCCGACPPVVVNPAHSDCEACRTGYDCTCAEDPRCPNVDLIALARRWDTSDLTDVGLADVLDWALRLADEVERRRAIDIEGARMSAVAAVTPCTCSAQRARADKAEVERDRDCAEMVRLRGEAGRLRAAVDRVRKLAYEWDDGMPDSWLECVASLRQALDGGARA